MSAQVIEHNGVFAIATWDDRAAQWTAPMTAEARRLTGCLAVFARSEAGIVCSANVAHYPTRKAAERAIAKRAAQIAAEESWDAPR